MTEDLSNNLSKSRVYFLTVIGLVVAAVLFLNRDALLNHPSKAAGRHMLASQNVPPATLARDVRLAVFDTETTGMDSFTDRLVELAVVIFEGGNIVDDRTWLINPERFIPEEVQKVHGITPEMVADERTFDAIYPEFLEFVQDSVLVAHNAAFDVKFMKREIERAELPPAHLLVLDSLRVFRAWFPDMKSHSIEPMARALKLIDDEGFHRAKVDSAYVGRIFYAGLKDQPPDLTIGELLEDTGGVFTL